MVIGALDIFLWTVLGIPNWLVQIRVLTMLQRESFLKIYVETDFSPFNHTLRCEATLLHEIEMSEITEFYVI